MPGSSMVEQEALNLKVARSTRAPAAIIPERRQLFNGRFQNNPFNSYIPSN